MASRTLGRLALAALGVIAYQNRDKLGQLLKGDPRARDPNDPARDSGLLGSLNIGGIGDIIDRFRNAGSGSAADSWIGHGPNEPIGPEHVERAIDPETLDALAAQTGLDRDEILKRLAVNLPEAVNDMTPEGRLPDDPEQPAAAKPTSGEPTLLDPAPSRPQGNPQSKW